MSDGKNNAQCAGSVLPGGTILRGRYRIEKPLGQGGFGITYAALDTKTYNRVAIKELFPSRTVNRAQDLQTVQVNQGQEKAFCHMRVRFEEEAQTLIQLQSQEGVVRLMHLFGENNTAYYVMELLDGEDLSKRLKREGTMNWDELAPILKTLLKALEEIHAVGMIHRDLTPDNIFLTEKGARLIDFGSVRTFQGGQRYTALVKQNFAPWEQFLTNGHQGPWTDIYSLSVTAYYCLSGQLPPPAPERRLNDKIKPLDTLCPNLPREICAAIHQGMAVMPEKRFQNVDQLRRALFSVDRSIVPRSGEVICHRGYFAGKSWSVAPGSYLKIGRNPNCHISYPPDFHGVSRAQCTIYRKLDGQFLIKDDHSSFGTKIQSPGKLVDMEPEVWYNATGAQALFGAQEEYIMK